MKVLYIYRRKRRGGVTLTLHSSACLLIVHHEFDGCEPTASPPDHRQADSGSKWSRAQYGRIGRRSATHHSNNRTQFIELCAFTLTFALFSHPLGSKWSRFGTENVTSSIPRKAGKNVGGASEAFPPTTFTVHIIQDKIYKTQLNEDENWILKLVKRKYNLEIKQTKEELLKEAILRYVDQSHVP